MRHPLMALILVSVTLSGCSAVRESRFNPFNWFGQSREEAVATAESGEANTLIPRRSSIFRDNEIEEYAGVPLEEVRALTVERVPGGALIRVTGLAARQGAYDLRLDADEDADAGTLAYTLRGVYNPQIRNTGAEATREFTAATKVTDQDLQGIRTIRVSARTNARSVRR